MPYNPSHTADTGGAPDSLIDAVRERHTPTLMAIDGVVGVAAGQDSIGNDAIVVYLRDESIRQRLPRQVEGWPVIAIVTGPIDANRASSL
jgi:hypothetical protein